jgi:hypothetical protein
VLHESVGLRITRNPRNRFVIARLHFSADPAKRDPKWRAEAAYGMTPEQAARELDIDFTALMGAKVFPEIHAREADIVVPEPFPDFGPDARYWGGLDYGRRNPTSFHVYTIVDGVMYVVWELYRPAPNIKEFAEEMQQFPYWRNIRYIAADPDMFLPKQATLTGRVSQESLFREAGVRNLLKGDNQREQEWITIMREHWQQEEPTFKIFASCHNMLREFRAAVYINQSERQLATQNFREEITNHDNHALDDCKYLVTSRPQEKSGRTFEDPSLVSRWGQGGGRTATGRPSREAIRGYQ